MMVVAVVAARYHNDDQYASVGILNGENGGAVDVPDQSLESELCQLTSPHCSMS